MTNSTSTPHAIARATPDHSSHKDAVEWICKLKTLRSTRFWQTLKARMNISVDAWEMDFGGIKKVLPDAFRFMPYDRLIEIYEVVNTSPITSPKVLAYQALLDAVTDLGWDIDIYTVSTKDRSINQFDLSAAFINEIRMGQTK